MRDVHGEDCQEGAGRAEEAAAAAAAAETKHGGKLSKIIQLKKAHAAPWSEKQQQ